MPPVAGLALNVSGRGSAAPTTAGGDHVAMRGRFRPLVLCYHAVSRTWTHILSVPPERFERQLRLVLALRYRAVPAASLLRGGRVLHVTFDDAFRSVLAALPTLERLQIPATIFACPGFADSGGPLAVAELEDEVRSRPAELETMDWDTLHAVAERGVEIGSHTWSHAHLPELSDADLARELRESRERLESELARRCRFLAYPYGEHDQRVREAARASGYELAFALPGRSRPVDPFALPRVGIWGQDGLARTAVKASPLRHAIVAVRRAS